MSEIYLVTGANSGLGLDSVRRLAMMASTKKIYMGCRTEAKANQAIASLKGLVDTSKLQYIHFDASASKKDIFRIVDSLEGVRLSGLLLNAGGIGHDKSKKPSGPNHVLDIHQINLIGHIQLVEALKSSQKMVNGCKIVFSGSEAARGVPMMMIGKPKLGETSAWYEKQLKGEFRGFDPMAVYAKTKGFAALYFAEWARQNPEYKVWVVSPGGTSGTSALSADAVPFHFKLMMPVMMPVMKAIGVMHPLEDGTDRYIQVLTGDNQYPSGSFIASKHGTTGKVGDQTLLRSGKQYADRRRQKAAFDALAPYALPNPSFEEAPTTEIYA